jgi:NTE family protein
VCTAADAETGAFRVWDAAAGVDPMRAVAASCAVPGLYPPVTIAGRRYIDGGVRSPTNADLATGCDDVLLVAVTLKPFGPMMEAAARRELAPIEAAGGRTLLIVPDEPSLEAFGPNLMDTARRAQIAEAGLRQGRNEAARLDAWK